MNASNVWLIAALCQTQAHQLGQTVSVVPGLPPFAVQRTIVCSAIGEPCLVEFAKQDPVTRLFQPANISISQLRNRRERRVVEHQGLLRVATLTMVKPRRSSGRIAWSPSLKSSGRSGPRSGRA